MYICSFVSINYRCAIYKREGSLNQNQAGTIHLSLSLWPPPSSSSLHISIPSLLTVSQTAKLPPIIIPPRSFARSHRDVQYPLEEFPPLLLQTQLPPTTTARRASAELPSAAAERLCLPHRSNFGRHQEHKLPPWHRLPRELHHQLQPFHLPHPAHHGRPLLHILLRRLWLCRCRCCHLHARPSLRLRLPTLLFLLSRPLQLHHRLLWLPAAALTNQPSRVGTHGRWHWRIHSPEVLIRPIRRFSEINAGDDRG